MHLHKLFYSLRSSNPFIGNTNFMLSSIFPLVTNYVILMLFTFSPFSCSFILTSKCFLKSSYICWYAINEMERFDVGTRYQYIAKDISMSLLARSTLPKLVSTRVWFIMKCVGSWCIEQWVGCCICYNKTS